MNKGVYLLLLLKSKIESYLAWLTTTFINLSLKKSNFPPLTLAINKKRKIIGIIKIKEFLKFSCLVIITNKKIAINNLIKFALSPIKKEIMINLPEQKIIFGNSEIRFEIDEFKKKCLNEGLDDIALSLGKAEKIVEYEKKIKNNKPWIFND